MRLDLPVAGLGRYKSSSQRARVATEAWAAAYLYCPNCVSGGLTRYPANTPATDYVCPDCDSRFQLKSTSRRFSSRITDAAYHTMLSAILEERTPNLLALEYQRERWMVQNLILIPHFAFSPSILERRKPLGPHARRAGWVGCNFLLDRIPLDARISVVADGIASSPADVRRQYARLRPLAALTLERRSWTLDVLSVVRSMGKDEFSLQDVYAFERDLGRLHPANRHVRDKIRQQLQVLRDLGLVEFLGRGSYRLRRIGPF